MKAYERMKEIELQVAGALRHQLERIPSLEIHSIVAEAELKTNHASAAPRCAGPAAHPQSGGHIDLRGERASVPATDQAGD